MNWSISAEGMELIAMTRPAKTLEDVMDHYGKFFALGGLVLTPQDKIDVIAFMKLLR